MNASMTLDPGSAPFTSCSLELMTAQAEREHALDDLKKSREFGNAASLMLVGVLIFFTVASFFGLRNAIRLQRKGYELEAVDASLNKRCAELGAQIERDRVTLDVLRAATDAAIAEVRLGAKA